MDLKVLQFLILFASSVGFFTRPATAMLTIVPAEPSVQDSVTVKVESGFLSLCWHDAEQECNSSRPDTLSITVDVDYCGGAPSCRCAELPHGYKRTCNFGLLPAGSYTAIFTELHSSVYDPIATFNQTVHFAVNTITPVLQHTWGTLKLYYH